MVIRGEREREGESKEQKRGAKLVISYGLVTINPYNGHQRREKEGESKEREKALDKGEVLIIKMSRFVFITTAIIKTLCYYYYSNNNNNNKNSKSRNRTREEEESRERTLPGMRTHEPLLIYPGFNALFYMPSQGGHQRSPTSPIRSKME